MSEDKVEPGPLGPYPNLETAYKEVVGFPFPKEPSEMPSEMLLPLSATGDFIDSIIAIELEDPHVPQGIPKERSQFVGTLNSKGQLENSQVVIGSLTEGGLEDILRKYSFWVLPLVGKTAKFLTYWHTHARRKYGPHLSTSDAAKRVGEDSKSMIYLVGGVEGIMAVFQTQAGIPKKIPFSTVQDATNAFNELIQFYDSSAENPDFAGLAKFFEQRGYVLYVWDKANPDDTISKAQERGNFLSGIPLRRIQKSS